MTDHRIPSRRQFLATCSAGFTLLAGCNTGSVNSVGANEEGTTITGEDPKLALSAHPTAQAGEVRITVEARDDTGLLDIQFLFDDEPVYEQDLNGNQKYTADSNKQRPADAFEWNTVT